MKKQIPSRLTNDHYDGINRLAIAFRSAIKQSNASRFLIGLQDFPNGACGDASLLFAEHLNNQGYGRPQYVLGYLDEYSHAWLELGGTIIDITADQFQDYTETRFVVQDMTWHKKFLEGNRYIADWRRFGPRVSHPYEAAYSLIVEKLADLDP